LHHRIAAAALLALASLAHADTPSVAPTSSSALPELRSTWDLTPLFADDAAWDSERRAVAAELPAVLGLREGFGRDAAALRTALDRVSALQRRWQRVAVYANTHASTDQRAPRNQERTALVRAMSGQVASATSWVRPAVQALGREKVDAFIAAEPGLQKHAVRLRDHLRLARHTLAPEVENALAAMAPMVSAPGVTRSMLATVDIEWPTLEVDGQKVRLNDVGYQRLREHPDREVRKRAFEAFFRTYGRFQNTLGVTLAQRVEHGVAQARLRGQPGAMAASLAVNDIPIEVYRTLLSEVERGLPVLHRYFKLRQRMLGLPDLAYHDIYPDIVKSERRFGLAESAALTLASVAPLGADYQAALKRAYAANTMHVHPAEGKQSGAYQSGVYGLTPLIFLNHRDTFGSASTFTHEWGHGMHTILAQGAQPFESAGYPLFLAEIAAFTHELLLQQHVLREARDRKARLFFLGEAVERLRGAFFRQAMFAEFELAAHETVERGEPLTGQRMTRLYCELLRKYHGAERGVMSIDPTVCSEWAYIPHFYSPFYVYQYATSMAAAHHFATALEANRPGARERYLAVLRSGGAQHPVPLLKTAGLDMTSPEPYRALVRQMDRLIDEMEKLIDG
jgi:oligoendopeptidase F